MVASRPPRRGRLAASLLVAAVAGLALVVAMRPGAKEATPVHAAAAIAPAEVDVTAVLPAITPAPAMVPIDAGAPDAGAPDAAAPPIDGGVPRAHRRRGSRGAAPCASDDIDCDGIPDIRRGGR